jgi:hypothetical protein
VLQECHSLLDLVDNVWDRKAAPGILVRADKVID